MTTQEKILDTEYRDEDTLEDLGELLSERDYIEREQREAQSEVPEWIALGLQK